MLNSFILIRKKLINVNIQKTEIEGQFTLEDNDVTALNLLKEKSILENFAEVDGKNISIDKLIVGQNIKIKLYSNRISEGNYYETFDDLVKNSNQKYPVNHFYVKDLDYDSLETKIKPNLITSYEAVTNLISLLVEFSDYQKDNELVFSKTKLLIIITDYKTENLRENLNIDELISHILDSVDKEERKIIFINELTNTLGKILDTQSRFKFLLDNFQGILNNYKNSHSLYLEKFSYQKIKSEIDKEILEYSKKIQSVINDAQTKFVAIPAAFLIVVSQFDLSGEKSFFNIFLILSTLIFSILLELLLSNQISALNFISDDVERFKNSIEKSKIMSLGNDNFNMTFIKIHKLYLKQKLYLHIIRTIIWLTPVFALLMLIYTLNKKIVLSLPIAVHFIFQIIKYLF